MTAALCLSCLPKQQTSCSIKSARRYQYVSGGTHDQLSGTSSHGHVQMLGCHLPGVQNHRHVGLKPLEQERAAHAPARLSSTRMTLSFADLQRGGIQACWAALSRLQRGLAGVQKFRSVDTCLGVTAEGNQEPLCLEHARRISEGHRSSLDGRRRYLWSAETQNAYAI